LCYESDWQICHRRRVAEILAQRYGFAVGHLAANQSGPGPHSGWGNGRR
jgi:hypothetical protein